MGAVKNKMLEWMQDQGLYQSDLDEMEDINKEFNYWLSQQKLLKPE